jgi:hypothetical protein
MIYIYCFVVNLASNLNGNKNGVQNVACCGGNTPPLAKPAANIVDGGL